MGIKIMSSGSSYLENSLNPDPKNFFIKRAYEHNNHSIIFIHYKGCTNYEGNKIIVYKNTSLKDLAKLKEIDPHFIENNKVKPFARFEPTKEGWDVAIKFIKTL